MYHILKELLLSQDIHKFIYMKEKGLGGGLYLVGVEVWSSAEIDLWTLYETFPEPREALAKQFSALVYNVSKETHSTCSFFFFPREKQYEADTVKMKVNEVSFCSLVAL